MCKGFPKRVKTGNKQTQIFFGLQHAFSKMNLHEVNVRLYMKTEKSETYEAAMSRLKCQTMRDLEANKRIHG